MPRPITFPLIIPIFFLLCVLFLLILPLTVEPESTGMALVMILVGVPVYLIFVKWKNKPKSWNNFFAKLTVLGQKTCNVVGEKDSWFCKSRRNLALCSVCLSVCVNRLVTAAIVFLVIYWCENLYDDSHQILCFSCIYNCSLNSFCKLCPPTEL